MTEPTVPSVLAPALAPSPPVFIQSSPIEFPLGWLLDHASPPIQYRSLVDVAKLPVDARGLSALPYASRQALVLAFSQASSGLWNNSMLGIPSQRAEQFEGVGTINAVRRLLEYGWDRESPPLTLARRVLFRLLAEDEDPAYLFELAPKRPDEELARRARAILREAAAAALAQAGYEGDPRLRGAARRILDRIDAFLRSPVAAKPWVRVGNKQVLAQEAAPPSFYSLTMLAHMPLFRNEHHTQLDRIYHYLCQPLPRQESQQLYGDRIVSQPHLVLGDLLPHRNAADADVPGALFWLELMARLNFIRRSENWNKLFERFLDDRDRNFVWHPHKGAASPKSTNPFAWPIYPLEDNSAGDERWSDVTFRLGLIARYSGRQIELV